MRIVPYITEVALRIVIVIIRMRTAFIRYRTKKLLEKKDA